ncbi:hypothetical protein DYB37_000483 [Aphanomyces astaci]|uniref:Uncharacterized protein n=1 Tax=Aphanomyces astaci TaxID=112090 RepID=A0A3R7CLR1_APHAT|nr:hypothetical protein DYB37_000483 [Aphanomyces astaci]
MTARPPRYSILPAATGGVHVRVPVPWDTFYLTALVVVGAAAGYSIYILEVLVLHSSSALVIPIVFGGFIATFVLASATWNLFGCEVYTFTNTKTITYEWQALCVRKARTFDVDLMKPFQVVASSSSPQITRPTIGFLYDGQMVRLGFALKMNEATDFLQGISPFLPDSVQPFQIHPMMIQGQIQAMEALQARRTSLRSTKMDESVDIYVPEAEVTRDY